MKNVKYLKKIAIVLPLAFFILSCNPVENDTRSASILRVVNILGTDMEGQEVSFLQSDVLYVDPSEGTQTIFSDSAIATLEARLLAPFPVFGSSQYNDITLTKYVVSYWRADGNNTEGVDVPFSFEGYLSNQITIDNAATFSIVVVREVAKAEPPLVYLRQGRDLGVLEVQAKIEFYGHDGVDRNVTATGYLTIFFANYANSN